MSDFKLELFDLKLHKTFTDEAPPGGPTPAPAVDVEARCVDCWGQVAGAKDGQGRWTRLECRVCGLADEGEQAHREMQRMLEEVNDNLDGARIGRPSRYRKDGRYFLKILPDMVRDQAKVDREIAAKLKEERGWTRARKKRYVTRRNLGKGGAGYYYFQACGLMRGLEYIPREFGPIPPFSDVLRDLQGRDVQEFTEAGSKSLRIQGELVPAESKLVKSMGTTLLKNMIAAFACELGLKGLLMTRRHEFRKTHDLKALYDALPADCRKRLKADFRLIEKVFCARRGTFDKWRYFDSPDNSKFINNLTDSDGALDLAKAARVLIDEGLIAGLNFDVKVGPVRYEVSEEGRERRFGRAQIGSGEAAINWDDFAR